MFMRKPKVLLIDDEVDYTKIMSIRLKACNFEVIVANSGIEGIKKAKAEKPDIIVLDIKMPDRDGFHIFKDIREDREIKDTPIIIISGIASQEEIATTAMAMEINPGEILIKPFETEKLLEKMREILKN